MIGDRRDQRVADLRTYITAFFITTLVARILIALFVTREGFQFSAWLDPSSWFSSIAVGFALTANGVFFDEHDVLTRLPVWLVVIIEVVFSTLLFRVLHDVFITQDFFTAAAWLEPKTWIGVGGFALIMVVGRRYYAAKEAAHSDR